MAKNQTAKMESWNDEAGTRIPYNRTTKSERLMERKSWQLLKEAERISRIVASFKTLVKEASEEVYALYMSEKNIGKPQKGNFTWYNFDRSIKIEVSINERITFDDLTITATREKLDQFLEANIESKVDFVKDLVNEAFKTSRGQLDPKKVLGLTRYRSKINDVTFHEALNLIESAVRRPESKTYYRVWSKDEEGKYQAVELNFSNI